MTELNIVNLIEQNPITRLSNTYQGKLVNKIKKIFTDKEQQLFIASFYCYLNCNEKTDFVIDLDKIWQWLGFSNKDKAKRLLEKSFLLDNDYKCLLTPKGEQKNGRGGHNIIKVMMTVKTFKSFCLKADTKKADEIHEYYMKLEETLHEVINEETTELKNQLENVLITSEKQTTELKNQLENVLITTEKEKDTLKERTLLDQFPKNTQCIYYGKIDNKSVTNEPLVKFGYSNELNRRVDEHKKNFTNFTLVNAFKVSNQIQIENAIKKHEILKKKRRNILIENINFTELLSIKDITFENLDKMIKDIIKENEYNLENYKLLIEKYDQLEYNFMKLENEMKTKDKEIENLKEKLANYKPDITNESKHVGGDFNITKYGYFLYAFEYDNLRYKCSIVRQSGLDILTDTLKKSHSKGEMKYFTKVSYPFTEKIMIFIMKSSLCFLGNGKFEGTFEDVKKAIDLSIRVEKLLIDNSKNLDQLSDVIIGIDNQLANTNKIENPEVPIVRKSRRAIDQIDPVTNKVIVSYESIEAAGRALGLTTGTAIGIALRNKTLCRSFLWRYSGISRDDQYSDQPVIKICCSTGEKTHFNNMADAARDVNISAPGLRNRILTNVHSDNHHWVFDKTTHYS
jgi:hypothetical protein